MFHTSTSLLFRAAAARERATSARLRAEMASNCAKSIECSETAKRALPGTSKSGIGYEDTAEQVQLAIESAKASSRSAEIAEKYAQLLELEYEKYFLAHYQPIDESDVQDDPLADMKDFIRRANEFSKNARLQTDKAYQHLRDAQTVAEKIKIAMKPKTRSSDLLGSRPESADQTDPQRPIQRRRWQR